MIEISTADGQIFDLPIEYSIDLSLINPLLEEMGSYSLPFNFPLTENNIRIIEYRNRLSNPIIGDLVIESNIKINGLNQFAGTITVEEIDYQNNLIQVNFQCGRGSFSVNVANLYLSDLTRIVVFSEILNTITKNYPDSNFALYPIRINKGNESRGIVNKWDIENQEFQNANLCPHFFICFILDAIFEQLGYIIETNDLKSDTELSQLTICNLEYDYISISTTSGILGNYLPDFKILDFIKGIEAKGFKFIFNDNSKKVSIYKLNTILLDSNINDVTDFKPLVQNFGLKRGLKLTKDPNGDDQYFSKYCKEISDENITFVEFYSELAALTSIINTAYVVSEDIIYKRNYLTSGETIEDYNVDTVYKLFDKVIFSGTYYYAVGDSFKNIEPGSIEGNVVWKSVNTLENWYPFGYAYNTYTKGDGSIEVIDNTLSPLMIRENEWQLIPVIESGNVNEICAFQFWRGKVISTINNTVDGTVATYIELEAIEDPTEGLKIYVENLDTVYQFSIISGWEITSLIYNYFAPFGSSNCYNLFYDGFGTTTYVKIPSANISLSMLGIYGLYGKFWINYFFWISEILKEVDIEINFSAYQMKIIDIIHKIKILQTVYFYKEIKFKINSSSDSNAAVCTLVKV